MAVAKVLVVDDSPAELENIRLMVAATGRTVLVATSGHEAVVLATSEQPDLIFLDIVMDDMDGYGACQAIRENPDTSHIPVVMVSSKNQRFDRIWADRHGAHGVISKPYTAQEIAAELERY